MRYKARDDSIEWLSGMVAWLHATRKQKGYAYHLGARKQVANSCSHHHTSHTTPADQLTSVKRTSTSDDVSGALLFTCLQMPGGLDSLLWRVGNDSQTIWRLRPIRNI